MAKETIRTFVGLLGVGVWFFWLQGESLHKEKTFLLGPVIFYLLFCVDWKIKLWDREFGFNSTGVRGWRALVKWELGIQLPGVVNKTWQIFCFSLPPLKIIWKDAVLRSCVLRPFSGKERCGDFHLAVRKTFNVNSCS